MRFKAIKSHIDVSFLKYVQGKFTKRILVICALFIPYFLGLLSCKSVRVTPLVDMSSEFDMINQTVKFYIKGLLKHDKSLVETALELIEFGRQGTVIICNGKWNVMACHEI